MAENGPFGTPPLTPKIPFKKAYVGPFFRPFPGNEAHELLSGGPKWGVLGGGQKVYVEKVYVLFRSTRRGGGRKVRALPRTFVFLEFRIREKQRGVENSGEGKTYHKSPPQKRFWIPPLMIRFPPPPFVHAMSFSLEETDTDQTNPTF